MSADEGIPPELGMRGFLQATSATSTPMIRGLRPGRTCRHRFLAHALLPGAATASRCLRAGCTCTEASARRVRARVGRVVACAFSV